MLRLLHPVLAAAMLGGGGNGPGEVGTGVASRRRRAALSPSAKGKVSAEGATGGVALGDQLLATKLYAPFTRADLTARPRLTGRLDEGTKAKLTLVVAPAGCGKSTLLGEWVLQSNLPVGWLALEEGDDDPARFLRYVIAAIQTVEPEIGGDALSVLGSPQRLPTRAVSTMLVNGLAAVPHDLGLILDDYHAIESEAVHATLAFLLEHLPPQMHLIIASRTDPPLPLTRLLASGQLTNLTASDLRFTSEEATDFLGDAMGLELSPDQISALEQRTEGWIAGLQLAALSLRGQDDVSGFIATFAGTNRVIFDYLAEEVLDRQPKAVREFLLETSILDRLTSSLCDAVTGRGDAQTTLEKLEGANLLFIPLDDQRRWYRYHHLFSDFLRERLRRESPEIVSELHLRASDWHERNGTAGEAVAHALAAQDFARAGDLIERLSDSMVGRGETPMLARLVRTFPEEIMRSRPSLYLEYTLFVLMDDGRWAAAEAALREVERMLGIGDEGVVEPIEDQELARRAGDVATIRANIAYEGHGDLPRAIALNRRALELLAHTERGAGNLAAINLAECLLDIGDLPAAGRAVDEAIEMCRVAEYRSDLGGALCHLGRLQTTRGYLSVARKTYERVLRLSAEADEGGLPLVRGMAHARLGELLFEWNDLEAAARHASLGIELALEWAGMGEGMSALRGVTESHNRLEEVDSDAAHGVVPGYITLVRVRQAQGDAKGALEALRKIGWVAQNSRLMSPLWKDRAERWGAAWQARLWIAEGNLRAANHWAQDRNLKWTGDPDYSSELEYVTLARLLLAQGKCEEVAHLLGRLMDAAETGGRRHTVMELLVLKALVLKAQNDGPGALATLERALLLAEPEGYIRIFADEGEPMADLLRRLLMRWKTNRPDDVPLEYAGTILEALGAGVTARAGTHARGGTGLILDPITGRELEVLELLDSDLSNREIAAKLFVSLATIKSHTKHLYRKLGVSARHQAVARGRELGLL
jgi:LuxR family transcriptional regulator, maltose regulon positive regulatory protein